MVEKDFPAFAKSMAGLAELYKAELSKTLLNIYWTALQELSLEDFNTAVTRIIKTSKFFPKPAEFLEGLTVSLEGQAAQAYDKVQKACREAGGYKTVIFDDPIIHAVIHSLGGWQKYCGLPEEEIKWYRKDFEKLYKLYAPKIDQMEVPERLEGGFDKQNILNGYPAQEPVIIGDKVKALGWSGGKKAISSGSGSAIALKDVLKTP